MRLHGRSWFGGRVQRGALRTARGFTIVETMVVLAVTGALFIAIATSLSGRQNAAEFTHAIQSLQSQIQQTIDQVSNGFYPNMNNFSCVNSAGSVQINPTVRGQGTNQDCVFLGKAVQFAVANTDPEQYRVYTVAGLRCSPAAPPFCPPAGASSPFQGLSPAIIHIGSDYADYSTTGLLEYGLKTQWMHSNGKAIGGVAFLMEPGTQGSPGASGSSSGVQQIDLIPLPPAFPPAADPLTAIAAMQGTSGGLQDVTLRADAPINPPNGVQLCFTSSGTNQSGLITIGAAGRQLTVKLEIKSSLDCS